MKLSKVRHSISISLALSAGTASMGCNHATPPVPCVAASEGVVRADDSGERFVPWFVTTDVEMHWSPAVTAVDGALLVLADNTVLKVEEQGLVSDSSLSDGLSFDMIEGPDSEKQNPGLVRPGIGHITAIQGDLEHLAVAMVQSTYAITIDDVYLRRNQRWKLWRHFWSGLEKRPLGVQVGPPGRAIMLVQDWAAKGYAFDVAADTQLPIIPIPQPGGADTGCQTAITPAAFVVLATGEVIVAGQQCQHPEAAIVETWDAGAKVSRLIPAPNSPAIRVRDVRPTHANSIYVGGCTSNDMQPYLAHVSGTSWEAIEPPPAKGCIESLAMGDDAWWVLLREPTPVNPSLTIATHDPGRTQLWKKGSTMPWQRQRVSTPWEVECIVTDLRHFPGSKGHPNDVWLTVAPVYDAAWPSNGRALMRRVHTASPR